MTRLLPIFVVAAVAVGCGQRDTAPPARASGYVDATEVRIAAKVPGRVTTVTVNEGARVTAGDTVATIATDDLDLALQRTRAERAQADAQVRLLQAGSRVKAATDRQAAASAVVARLQSGARPQEVEAARARVAAVDAQIATI